MLQTFAMTYNARKKKKITDSEIQIQIFESSPSWSNPARFMFGPNLARPMSVPILVLSNSSPTCQFGCLQNVKMEREMQFGTECLTNVQGQHL